MSIEVSGEFSKSDYEKALEAEITQELATITASASLLTAVVSAAVTALSAVVTVVSAAVTVVSGNITSQFDVTSATLTNTYTLDISSIRNFNLLNADTAGKTLMITGVPTAGSTMVELKIRLNFTTTASITYTGTITWSTNTAPNPTAAGSFILNLKTWNAGVNWYASFSGLY